MKKVLIILSIYSLLIMLLTIFSLYRSLGTRMMISPQMFLINFLVILPVIIFSLLALVYLGRK